MRIINDRKNNKTIDTETGVYLTLVDEHGYSGHLGIELHDHDNILYLSLTSETSNRLLQTYVVNNIGTRDKMKAYNQGMADKISFEKYQKYRNTIELLLIAFKEYHGMLSNLEVRFQVNFDKVDNSFGIND